MAIPYVHFKPEPPTMASAMILLLYRRERTPARTLLWVLKNRPGLPVAETSPLVQKESGAPSLVIAPLLAALSSEMDTNHRLRDYVFFDSWKSVTIPGHYCVLLRRSVPLSATDVSPPTHVPASGAAVHRVAHHAASAAAMQEAHSAVTPVFASLKTVGSHARFQPTQPLGLGPRRRTQVELGGESSSLSSRSQ